VSNFQPPDLIPSYRVDAIEFRDHALVISYTETDQYATGGKIIDHVTREIMPGEDPELDARIVELHDEISQILDMAYVAKRRPPGTRPGGGRRPAPNTGGTE
jgi:hypothetical protein